MKYTQAQIREIKKYLSSGTLPVFLTSRWAVRRFIETMKQYKLKDGKLYTSEGKQVIASEDINEVLNKLYSDPETRANGIQRFYKRIADLYSGITYRDVAAFLQSQETYQRMRQVYKGKSIKPVVARGPNVIWQADLILMDSNKLPWHNNGIKYLLTVIDCFTKYAWTVPLKRATSEAAASAFEGILHEHVSKAKDLKEARQLLPLSVQTDNGNEFAGEFDEMLERWNIKHIRSQPHTPQAQGIIEHFNRTLKSSIFAQIQMSGTKRYIDALEAIMRNYNTSFHTTIKTTPALASKGKKNDSIAKHLQQRAIKVQGNVARISAESLHKGDKVRIALIALFSSERAKKIRHQRKAFGNNWSKEVFTVASKSAKKQIKVEELPGRSFERWQLQKISI